MNRCKSKNVKTTGAGRNLFIRSRSAATVGSLAILAIGIAVGAIATAQTSSTAAEKPSTIQSPADGGMISPAIDVKGQPFSYPSKSVDEIGVMYSPSAAEITPEGYLYTGFGELMFFAGPDLTPVSQRIRTLTNGYLPIVNYTVDRGGIHYHFEMFAASLGPKQTEGPVVNFVRVTVSNTVQVPKAAFFGTAVRYQAISNTASGSGDNRFARPIAPTPQGSNVQPGEFFNPDWTYGFSNGAFVRDGRVIYLFPQKPAPHLGLTRDNYYNTVSTVVTSKLNVSPTTPTGSATYSFILQPGESRHLDFKMPLLPVAVQDPEFSAIQSANLDVYREAVRQYWEQILGSGMSIALSEKKVTDTFNASLVYDLLALNKIGDDYVQTVNQLHYHRFWLRDASDIAHMYDLTGYPQIATRVLHFYLNKQKPDGNFLSQPGQYDGWGQTLWIFGEHYRFTHDQAFAEAVFPHMVHALDWFEQATREDPLHIMPATDVRDNEYVPGHITGYNFLALDGLDNAAYLADVLGKQADAKRIRTDGRAFRMNFASVLDRVTSKTNGYIPPTLDENGLGTDWGNLLSITPRPQLPLTDPRIAQTLRVVRAKYQEGLTTYYQPDQGQFLHHYLIFKNIMTATTIGDQEGALRELYAVLMHTSSTQEGFEYAIRPWGDRDFHGNLTPHGWFAAEYRSALRYMFVRESDNDLHLFSVVSPEWLGSGKTIEVTNVPTYFGKLGLNLSMADQDSAILHLDTQFTRVPDHLFVHIPWYYKLLEASADGKRVMPEGSVLEIPAKTKELVMRWHRLDVPVGLNYKDTVEAYQREYKTRYEQMLTTGALYNWEPSSKVVPPGTSSPH